jgi:hypothetical protein
MPRSLERLALGCVAYGFATGLEVLFPGSNVLKTASQHKYCYDPA